MTSLNKLCAMYPGGVQPVGPQWAHFIDLSGESESPRVRIQHSLWTPGITERTEDPPARPVVGGRARMVNSS